MWRYQPNAEDEYVGNIWGWKFSAFGAVLIVGLLLIAMLIARSRDKSLIDDGSQRPATEQVDR